MIFDCSFNIFYLSKYNNVMENKNSEKHLQHMHSTTQLSIEKAQAPGKNFHCRGSLSVVKGTRSVTSRNDCGRKSNYFGVGLHQISKSL